MNGREKGAIKSTTIQGAAIAGLPAIDYLLVHLGIIPEPVFAPAGIAVASAIGAIVATIGRLKAFRQITKFF